MTKTAPAQSAPVQLVVTNPAPIGHYSLYKFSSLKSAPFDTEEYSRLKFGSDRVARKFGRQLADAFFHEFYQVLTTQKCVVIPAPSAGVPVAATLIANHFFNRLNARLANVGHLPVEMTHVHRDMTYNNNYADLEKEQRQKLLAGDAQYFNRDFVKGKHIIFIDDVRITGSHEEKLESVLKSIKLTNSRTYVSFCRYTGSMASIEGKLNHCYIRDAKDLVRMAHEHGHVMTTRAIRLLLEYDSRRIDELLQQAPDAFLESAYYAAIVKGYNLVPEYEQSFRVLATYAKRISSG